MCFIKTSENIGNISFTEIRISHSFCQNNDDSLFVFSFSLLMFLYNHFISAIPVCHLNHFLWPLLLHIFIWSLKHLPLPQIFPHHRLLSAYPAYWTNLLALTQAAFGFLSEFLILVIFYLLNFYFYVITD